MNLDGLSTDDRSRFLAAYLARTIEKLTREFPHTSGYKHAARGFEKREKSLIWLGGSAVWSVTRGRSWGLWLSVLPEEKSLARVRVTVDTFLPLFTGLFRRIERIDSSLGTVRKVPLVDHLLVPLLLPFAIVLLPVIAGIRVASLFYRTQGRIGAEQVETAWSEMEGRWRGEIRIKRLLPQSLAYSLALLLTAGGTDICFRVADFETISDNWKTVLYVFGGILILVSLGLLIALVMTLLGLKVPLRARQQKRD